MAFYDSEITSELKLTTQQKKQIRAIEATMFLDKPPGPIDSSGLPPWKALEEKLDAVMKQILAVLTAEKTTRWNELTSRPFASASRVFFPGPGGFGPPPPLGKFDGFRSK